MSGYVAMGLQDGKLAPGWYNGYYLGVYNEDYDYEKSDAEFKTNVVNTLKNDLKDPSTGISRFSKKIQSEWNNPTFQSVWLVEEGNLKAITEGMGSTMYIYNTIFYMFDSYGNLGYVGVEKGYKRSKCTKDYLCRGGLCNSVRSFIFRSISEDIC